MKPERQRELDRLLAPGRLPGPTLERILGAALPRAARSRWRLLPLALVPAAAAAALLLAPRPDGFTERGRALGVQVELVCGAEVSASAIRCRTQDQLFFRSSGFAPGATSVFLAAWADPVAGGERVWFFPTASVGPLLLAASAAPQIAPRAIPLAGLPAGAYDVQIVLAPQPLARDQLVAAPAARVRLEVLP